MAKTLIELGEFAAKAINDDGAEVRLSDEKHKSNFLSRFKTSNKQFEAGATYRLYAEKVEEAPQPDKVIVEVPAANVPTDAKVIK